MLSNIVLFCSPEAVRRNPETASATQATIEKGVEERSGCVAPPTGMEAETIVQDLYDFSRNKLQQKVFQRFLVNRGVLYDILKV